MRIVKVGVPVKFHFTIWQVGGTTERQSGLADGDFVRVVQKDGVVQNVTVTVAEVGTSGEYVGTVTFPSVGTWRVMLTSDAHMQVVQEDLDAVLVAPWEIRGRAL